jgi:hypothetical protein
MASIDLTADLRGFFGEAVASAAENRDTPASDATLLYLAGLLADYGKPQTLERKVLTRPFTLLLQEALESLGPERFNRLRCLGDDVLYVTGFFGGHLERRGVPLAFVRGLGSRAYDEAANILRAAGPDSSSPDVFGELSTNFGAFVDIVSEVADGINARSARSTRDMLDVYERWLKTGSETLGNALCSWGVVPRRASGGLH